MSVLVYTEHTEGKFKKSAYEVVSYAKAIADLMSTTVTAVSIGNVDSAELAALGNYGASRVLHVSSEQLTQFVNQAYASVIAAAAEHTQADVVVISNTFSGKGLAPRVAAKLDAALADGAVELPEVDGNTLKVKKTAFSGKAFAVTELTAPKKVVALNPNAFEVRETGGSAEVDAFTPDIPTDDL